MSIDIPQGITFLSGNSLFGTWFLKRAGGGKMANECESEVVDKIGNEYECKKGGE